MEEVGPSPVTPSRVEPFVALLRMALLTLGPLGPHEDLEGFDLPEVEAALRGLLLTKSTVVGELLKWVYSDDYPCPGSHWSRVLDFSEKEALDDQYAYEGGQLTIRGGRPPSDVHWVGLGECPGTVTIDLETECDEYGGNRYDYPAAFGPCAEAFGIGPEEEGLYDHSIFGQFMERRRLRKVLEGQSSVERFARAQAERAGGAARLREAHAAVNARRAAAEEAEGGS